MKAPHSWGFLFVGRWVDLGVIKRIQALLFFIGLVFFSCDDNIATNEFADTDNPSSGSIQY